MADPEGRLVVDALQRLPGRGAHTCIDVACLDKAVQRGAFGRMLRRTVAVPATDDLVSVAAKASTHRAHQLLGLLRRGDDLVVGARPVQVALSESSTALVIVAVDHSERSAAEVQRAAADAGVSLARFSTGERLGRAIGRKATGVLGAPRSPLTRALALEVMKSNRLAPRGAQADGVQR